MAYTMNITLLKKELLKLQRDLNHILISKQVNSNVTVHQSAKNYVFCSNTKMTIWTGTT